MQTDIKDRIRQEIQRAAENSIIVNQEYLDDEQLTREQQFSVLTEIFNLNVRTEEIRAISNHFSPIFRNGHPIPLSIYGKPGTGKTITALWFVGQLRELCAERDIPFTHIHLDLCCPMPCFRALNTLACFLGASKHYKKGISLEELMRSIELKLGSLRGYLVIFVDEADNVRTDINTFYQFLIKRLPQRINAKLILVFTSNRLNWSDSLDPRVKSCMKARELLFEPYNAESLRHILDIRIDKALRNDHVKDGVVSKIAALASRQHGDARKAVNLLARSVYLAEKLGTSVTLDLVDQAYEEIERDKYVDMIRTSPKHLQAALYAALTGKSRGTALQTGDSYLAYERFCNETGLGPITQRAYTDLLGELDMYGFITARTVSRGRYGRTKEIHVSLPTHIQTKLIEVIRSAFDLSSGGGHA